MAFGEARPGNLKSDSAVVASVAAIGTGIITATAEAGLIFRASIDAINNHPHKDDVLEMLKIGGVGIAGMVCFGGIALYLNNRANQLHSEAGQQGPNTVE